MYVCGKESDWRNEYKMTDYKKPCVLWVCKKKIVTMTNDGTVVYI